MFDRNLKIETILGYVANDNPLRASKDGKSFEGLIPAPAWTELTVKRNGSVYDTVNEMRKIIKHYHWQASKLAPVLKGKNLYDTCKNIWDFLFYHIRYNEDTPGKEELRTLSRTFAERKTGVDCDDFSIACGCILRQLNIPFYIRIARYDGKNYFQHVYIVVPVKEKQYITIDGVLDEYDAEKTPSETKDFLVMNTNNLNGIDISVLGGIEDETRNEIAGILSGADFKEVTEMEGLGTPATEEQELSAIHGHLQRTRNLIASRPDLVSDSEHPESFLGMADYALKYWHTPKRDEALGILEGEETRLNELEGLGNSSEGYEDVELFHGLSEDGTYNILGKIKRQRKFFTKVREAVKRAGKGITKLAKGLVRYNPLTVTIRGSVLLALKINLFKIASKLKWGYLTEDEARAQGLDMGEWAKVKKQLAKAENMYVNILQGNAGAFKKAMLSGRAGKLHGIEDEHEFGIVPVVAAGAATTAVPFITKLLNLLKNINYKKLISTIKNIKDRKAAQADLTTPEGGSAMPEGGSANTPTDASDSAEGSSNIRLIQQGKKTVMSENNSGESSGGGGSSGNTADKNNPDNLPDDPNAPKPSFITKAMDWVKENKTTSILIGAGAAFLIYGLATHKSKKPKTALSGAGRGKKKKGNSKKNPPHSISGTGRKRGKGGHGKKYKL